MFCVYTLRQHPYIPWHHWFAYTLLQPLRIPKGARPLGLRPRGYNFEFPWTIFCHNTTL
jgi:hypothetical protein